MSSQMHLVQNAARLAMADHRAAGPRSPRTTWSLSRAVRAGFVFALSMIGRRVSAAD